MNDFQIFSNPEFGKVRTINVDGEPWFVGIDVAKSLGYQKPLDAVNTNVDEMDYALMGVIDSLGRNQQTKCINESGLYTLILGSKLEGAKRFRHWITHDVIPSIRKTGKYQINATYEKPTMAEVRYMELKAKEMHGMGCTPFEVSAMIARTSQAYHLYVSPVFANKVDPQLCLFDSDKPMLTA